MDGAGMGAVIYDLFDDFFIGHIFLFENLFQPFFRRSRYKKETHTMHLAFFRPFMLQKKLAELYQGQDIGNLGLIIQMIFIKNHIIESAQEPAEVGIAGFVVPGILMISSVHSKIDDIGIGNDQVTAFSDVNGFFPAVITGRPLPGQFRAGELVDDKLPVGLSETPGQLADQSIGGQDDQTPHIPAAAYPLRLLFGINGWKRKSITLSRACWRRDQGKLR